MKVSEKSNLYDLDEAFAGCWVNVRFNNGRVKKVFFLDFDFLEDNDVGDAIVYNTTGSYSYGDAIYLKDINEIELAKTQKYGAD